MVDAVPHGCAGWRVKKMRTPQPVNKATSCWIDLMKTPRATHPFFPSNMHTQPHFKTAHNTSGKQHKKVTQAVADLFGKASR